jgi:hypothetical protein
VSGSHGTHSVGWPASPRIQRTLLLIILIRTPRWYVTAGPCCRVRQRTRRMRNEAAAVKFGLRRVRRPQTTTYSTGAHRPAWTVGIQTADSLRVHGTGTATMLLPFLGRIPRRTLAATRPELVGARCTGTQRLADRRNVLNRYMPRSSRSDRMYRRPSLTRHRRRFDRRPVQGATSW